MITKSEFLRVQELLGRAGSFDAMEGNRAERRPKFRYFAFTGCMSCAECGCAITAEIKTKRQENGNIRHYTYYHCTHRKDKRDFRCVQRENVEERKLEGQIADILASVRVHSAYAEWARSVLKQRYAEETETNASVREGIDRGIEDHAKKRGRLMDLYLDGSIDRAELDERKRSVDRSIQHLELQRRAAEERTRQWVDLMERAFDFAVHAKDRFENGDGATKKSILLALGSNLRMRGGRVHVDLHPWLVPFQRPDARETVEPPRFEPKKKGFTKGGVKPFDDENLEWLGIFESVRNAIIGASGSVYIPNLNE